MNGNETDREADRTKRVKEARDEAKKEIDAYRKEKEDEFKKFEAEVCYAGWIVEPLLAPNGSIDVFNISTQAATRKQRRMPTRMPKSS